MSRSVPLLMLCLMATLSVTACKKTEVQDHKTSISTTTDVGGVTTRNALEMTGYAMRAALGTNPNTAAYVTITNRGNVGDRLLSASCACAAATSLHTMAMKDGVMEMDEARDGFAIAPGQTLIFAPGGNHIMLTGLKTRPQDGGTQDITLVFEKAGPVTLSLPVSNTPLAKGDSASAMSGMKM